MIALRRASRWHVSLLALVVSATLALGGCATLAAETPQQRAYAALADFRGAVGASADYCESPVATVERCSDLGALAHQGSLLAKAVEVALNEGTLSEAQLADLLRVLASIIERLEQPEPPTDRVL